MKCPKCNCDIDDKMLVCPNCKKVLKLVCPKCKTINKNNVCQKCGFTIIVKCHNCGKINQTISDKCSKCGFSTHSSVTIAASNIDEFACLSVTFPNIQDIKIALGSTKLFDKFRANLDKLILDYAKANKLEREIIDGTYVIRFNKNDSFTDSANSALKGAIELLNLVTELNTKLNKLKDTFLHCSIAVLKRDINTKPQDYKSGLDIKLIYQGKNRLKILNCLQVITDSAIYEKVCDNFTLTSLSSTFVKNQMIMFFELNIKKYVKIPSKMEEDLEDLPQLPKAEEQNSAQIENGNNLYNVESINFEELKCSFENADSVNIASEVVKKIKENPINIISVKSEKEFAPQASELLKEIEGLNKFENVLRVTCYDEIKYKPYGFFQDLISNICNFSKAPKNFQNNTFEMFNNVDPSNYIANLINALEREDSNPEEVRYYLFDVFFNIFSSISNSMIYIENFDKMDDTSYEILQLFFEKFEELKISYLVTSDKDFGLHKDSHFLLSNQYYTEITAKPSSLKEIITKKTKRYKNILKSYYMEKITANFKGSVLYFNQAIDYLLDNGVLVLDGGELAVATSENVFIPTTLEAIITKRLKYLAKDKNAYKLFAMLLFIGPSVDINTVNLLGIAESTSIIKKLIEKNYIYLSNDAIFFNNYNIYKDIFLSSVSSENRIKFAQELLDKVFTISAPSPIEAILYEILEKNNEEFICWEKLSRLNSSMGDFSAYLNCSVKFLKLLNDDKGLNLERSKDEYKMEVYDNISNLLYKYSPEKVHNIAQIILDNLEKSTDDQKIVDLCNKMLQGCLVTGNYQYALGLIRKILSKFQNLSINPNDQNFNAAFFFISLIKVEILFSIGQLKDCCEAAEEILNAISAKNLEALTPSHLSQIQFEDMIFDTMSFAALAKVLLLSNDFNAFVDKIYAKVGRLPKVFDLFGWLQYVIRGIGIDLSKEFKIDDDRFSKLFANMMVAFNYYVYDYKNFASYIYQAKNLAKANRLFQIELVCDLLIGYSYFGLKEFKKASSIYSNALEASEKNGLKTITQLSWYLISMLKFEEGNLDVALGIVNNAVIQLEKDENSSDFLFFLFKIVLYKILLSKGDKDLAALCLNNIEDMREKYGIELGIERNIVNDHYDGNIENENDVEIKNIDDNINVDNVDIEDK